MNFRTAIPENAKAENAKVRRVRAWDKERKREEKEVAGGGGGRGSRWRERAQEV